MNKETMPGGENDLEQVKTPEPGVDILDLEKDFINSDLDDIPEGTEGVYEEANEEKGLAIVQTREQLTRLDEKEELKEKKEKFIADIIGEKDPEKREELKKDYEQMLINEASLEVEKSESFEILSTGLADLSQAELKAKGGHFAEKVIGKIGQITDKGLYFYLPKKWKDSSGGKYLKYASSAAMVTALVAVLAPSSGAIASVGVAGYFGLKLVKTIIGAKIGGIVGAGAAKLYENLKGNKEEKMDQAKLEQAIENGEPIESVVDLIKEIENNKIKRENNKLKLALIGGLAGGLGSMSFLDLLEGATMASEFEMNAQHDNGDAIVDSAKATAKQGVGLTSGANKVIHELQRIFNLSH